MVGTISPVVYGPSRQSVWYRLMGIYALAQVAGGVLTGVVLGFFGLLFERMFFWSTTPAVASFAVIASIAGLRDLKLLRIRLPNRNWQVPQSWKRFPAPIMAGCYGFGIGLGALTRISFASFYVLVVACISMGNLWASVGLMAI
jgi:hypothetical protein